MSRTPAVLLDGNLYMGSTKLCIYSPAKNRWKEKSTPVYWFGLTSYHNQLVVVVGGELQSSGEVTNKLWTCALNRLGEWEETLPAMITKRWGTTAVSTEHDLIAAGGTDFLDHSLDVVEVYNGHQWADALILPKPCHSMTSTVLDGCWYLMGGEGQGKDIYYASLDALIASCNNKDALVWKSLANVPYECSSVEVIHDRLIAVGGIIERVPSPPPWSNADHVTPTSSAIHAYSPQTQSWMYVGDLPVELHSTCTIALPTGELMVIGGCHLHSYKVFKVFFNGEYICV